MAMTPSDALSQHRQVCDTLYEIALEENRFMQQQQRTPDAALVDRKRMALERLEETLAALRSVPGGSAREPEMRAALDKTRSRIMQILQLDRENEQLLLRCSLAAPRTAGTALAPNSALLQKIYARCK